jgi:hypothetical protein
VDGVTWEDCETDLELRPKFRTFKNSTVQYQWVTCHFEF